MGNMFKVNTDAIERRINTNVDSILEEIKHNCKEGIRVTEIEVSDFFETRKRVESTLKKLEVRFKRVDMGGMVSYSVGNGKRFGKIKILD
jgi:hypothetical protein|tara:strand:+ start:513 stop:782 length:270 start_codon:yes stop_codon:yes gene_type:complete